MSRPLEDYALIGDTRTAALVSLDGAIDWMCVPRFDSGACFAALLGDSEHGRWSIHPDEEVLSVERAYRGDTLVVDTTMHTVAGAIRITDLMVPEADHPTVIRQVTGLSGHVRVTTELRLRFDYGSIVPWVSQIDGRLHAIAGPDAVIVDASVPLVGRNMHTQATFDVGAGESVSFVFIHHPSHEPLPERIDAGRGHHVGRRLVDLMDAGVHRLWPPCRGDASLGHHAESTDVRPHRGNRGRAHHLTP